MPNRSNLLYIFTDQQRFDTLRCYGNGFVETPHLNALAERSAVVERCYVTQPICTPSRATMMTGLYPHTHRCVDNNDPLPAEHATIAEMLPDDYHKGYIGKWHLGDEVICQRGFDTWVSIEDMYRNHYSKPEYLDTLSDYHHFLVERGYEPAADHCGADVFNRGQAAHMPEDCTKAAFVGERAADYLRGVNPDEPYALYVNFLEPHSPFTGPLDDRYDPDAVPTGPAFLRGPGAQEAEHHHKKVEQFANLTRHGCDLSTEAGWRQLRAQYLGLVTQVDRAVGQIMQALEDSGTADHTVVVLTSDHGEMMGDHHKLTKGVFYE